MVRGFHRALDAGMNLVDTADDATFSFPPGSPAVIHGITTNSRLVQRS